MNKARNSIVFRLIVAVVIIFLAMVLILNYTLNSYQRYLLNKISDQLEVEILETEAQGGESILFILEEAEVRSLTEFRVFSVLFSILVISSGVAAFYFVIRRMLQPLKQLAEDVSSMDMESAKYAQNSIAVTNGGTEIRELSQAFDRAFGKLYESYERQREFSVNIAHELRTPLAILAAKIDVFHKKNVRDVKEVNAFVLSMKANIARLSEMVEGIMMLSRHQRKQHQEVSIRSLLEEILFDLEEFAETKGVTIELRGDDARLLSDDQLLERALFNLLENAVKYNESGGSVTITVEDAPETVRIRFADTGIGISDEEKAHIFDLFYRADPSRSRDTGGYGIGLALVRSIIQELGGTLSIRDNVPRGSVFEISLKKE